MSKMLKPGINVKPGTSKENKPALAHPYPKFDHAKCIACGTCETYCPEGIIFGTKNTNTMQISIIAKVAESKTFAVKCIEMLLEVR